MKQVAVDIDRRSKHLKPANTHLKKMCFNKCKSCKGSKCPNYYGYISNRKEYYSGVLHTKKIRFRDNISQPRQPMDRSDRLLVGGLIKVTIFLTIFGCLLL